jgi:hypothetical protein
MDEIGGLFSQSADKTSQSALELDQPTAHPPKTTKPTTHKPLSCCPTKKIQKPNQQYLSQKKKKPANPNPSKRPIIPPQRNNDTHTKVSSLRRHYQNGSYAYYPGKLNKILFKKLKLRELAPICREIEAIGQYRFMDYTFHLDASCLNENSADRNVLAWFSGLEMIKRVSSLTHDVEEKLWSWALEEPRVDPEHWARGLRFFPEFKKWALSFGHYAADNLVKTLEAKIDG